MANIANIDFKVILDDKEFNKTVKSVEDKAKKLNTDLSDLLKITGSGPDLKSLQDANQALQDRLNLEKKLNRAMDTRGKKEQAVTDAVNARNGASVNFNTNIDTQINNTNNGLERQSRLMGELKGLAVSYFSVAGVEKFLSSLIRISGEFEIQRTTLRAILQDVNGADAIFEKIKSLAVVSPYGFKDLVSYAKQLSAYSIPMNELYDTTKMLADVSAGLGVDMNRLVLAYGQIRSASFLRGTEVRQLTEAGIPILEQLRAQFEALGEEGVTVGDVFDKISRRMVPFSMVEKAFKDMTTEGGQFYQMQEIQADTLKGKISNLNDAFEIMMDQIGEKTTPVLKANIDLIREMMSEWQRTGAILMSTVAAYGAAKVALELYAVANGKAELSNLGFIKSIKNVAKWVANNPYALIAVGVAALTGTLVAALTKQDQYQKSLEIINKTAKSYNSEIDSELIKLKYLINQLEGAEKGTAEYEAAKKRLMSSYGQYLSDIDREKLAVKDLSGVYDNLAESVKEAYKEKALNAGASDLQSAYMESYTEIYKQLENAMKRGGVTDKNVKLQLWDYILGTNEGGDVLTEEAKKAVDGINEAIKNADKTGLFGQKVYEKLFNIEDLKENMTQAKSIYSTGLQSLSDELDIMYTTGKPKQKEMLDGWRKAISEVLTQAAKDGISGFDIDPSKTDLDQLLKDIKTRYDAVAQSANNAKGIDDVAYKKLTAQLEVLKQMDAILGGKALAQSKVEKKENAEEINRLEARGRALSKLMDWYDKLQDLGFSGGTIRDLLSAWMPSEKDAIAAGNYANQIQLVADSLKQYGDSGKRAAEQLEQGLGKDGLSGFLKSYEAIDKFRTKIQSWLDKDYNLEGTDVSFKISNILARMTAQNNGIDTEYAELAKLFEKATSDAEALKVIRETYGEETWASYLDNGVEAIEELARREKENNKKVAQEKINDLYKAYVEQQMLDQNIDASHWSEKSLSEIQRIKEALSNMIEEGLGELPYETQYNLLAAGISLEKFEEMYKQILELKYNDASSQYWEKLTKNLDSAFDAASKLAGAFDDLGSNANAPALRDVGKLVGYATNIATAFTESSEAMKLIAERKKAVESGNKEDIKKATDALLGSADFYTMLLKIALALVDGIASGIVAAYEQQRMLNEAANEYRATMNDIARKNYSNIFGTNELGLLAENYKIANDNFNEFAKSLKNTGNHNWLLQTGVEIASLEELAKRYPEVFNELGNVNMEYIKAMRDVWDAQGWGFWNAKGEDGSYVTQALMNDIDDLIAKYDEMQDANDELMSSFESLFGSLVDDVVDSFIESFDEMGDAVANLDSIFDNLGETILTSLLKTYVMENILNKYQDRFKKMMTDYASSERGEDAALQLAEAAGNLADDVKKDIAGFGGAINEIITAFRDNGLYGGEEASDATVASGIKGITEDTANLLASYINAMRADLSFMRGKQTSYIDYMMGAMPTLATHIASLDARAYDIAVSNAEIANNTAETLSELRSVIGSTSGLTAIRVESV